MRYSASRSRSRDALLLDAILAVLFNRRGQRRIEKRHSAAEGCEVGNALAARAIRWHQLRDGTPSLRDDDLATLLDLVQERRQVLARFADAGGAHDASVLHVAHRVKSRRSGDLHAVLLQRRLAQLEPEPRRLRQGQEAR